MSSRRVSPWLSVRPLSTVNSICRAVKRGCGHPPTQLGNRNRLDGDAPQLEPPDTWRGRQPQESHQLHSHHACIHGKQRGPRLENRRPHTGGGKHSPWFASGSSGKGTRRMENLRGDSLSTATATTRKMQARAQRIRRLRAANLCSPRRRCFAKLPFPSPVPHRALRIQHTPQPGRHDELHAAQHARTAHGGFPRNRPASVPRSLPKRSAPESHGRERSGGGPVFERNYIYV